MALVLLVLCLMLPAESARAAGWGTGENAVEGTDGNWCGVRSAMPGESVQCRAVFRVEGGREYVARSDFSEGVTLDTVGAPRQNGVPVNGSAYTVLTGREQTGGFEIHFSALFASPGPVTLEILYAVRLGDNAREENACAVRLEQDGGTCSGGSVIIKTFGFFVYRGVGIPESNKQSNPLPGACYSLYADSELTQRIAFVQGKDGGYLACAGTCSHTRHAYLMRTGENGSVRIRGLPAGTYYLTESRTPEGHKTMAECTEIVLSEQGEITAGGVPCPEGRITLVEKLSDRSTGRSDADPLAFYIHGSRILSALLAVMVLLRKRLFS